METKSDYPCGFSMTFDFSFGAGGYVQPTSPNNIGRRKVSFWGNSGIFIFGAVEIQIVDTRGMLAKLVPEGYSFQVGDDGTVQPMGPADNDVYEAENIGYLLTGVPYLQRPSGLSDPTGLRLSDCPLVADWNQMEIDVTPF